MKTNNTKKVEKGSFFTIDSKKCIYKRKKIDIQGKEARASNH